MESSVVFKPETDESALDDEVDKTNEAFQDAGNVELEVDKSDLENLGPDGPLEVGVEAEGGGVGGGVGGPGAGAQAGAAGLASKIPKTVSGSLAAAALPVALAGGIGVGLLSEMASASASLQTSSKILGIARDNFFRAPGELLDEKVARPIANGLLEQSEAFSQMFRDADFGGAAEVAVTGVDRRNAGLQERVTGILGSLGGAGAGAFAGAKAGGAAGATIGSVIPGAGTAAGGTIGAAGGALVGGVAGLFSGGRIATALSNAIGNVDMSGVTQSILSAFDNFGPRLRDGASAFADDIRTAASDFAGDIRTGASDLATDIRTGASDFAENIRDISAEDVVSGTIDLVQYLWNGTINLTQYLWNGSINLTQYLWNGSINLVDYITSAGWNWAEYIASGSLNWGQWMFSGAISWANVAFEGAIDIADYVTGQIFGGGDVESAASGGRVTRSGLAEIHKGETIADPDRLVSDLADAIGTASGGGGGGADMGAVESKLDTLHRDISRLASAMEQVELTVEGERLGELSKRTQASSRSNNLLTQ